MRCDIAAIRLLEKIPVADERARFGNQKLIIPTSAYELFQRMVAAGCVIKRCVDLICLGLRRHNVILAVAVIKPRIDDVNGAVIIEPVMEQVLLTEAGVFRA